jgi:hypothetical protein
MYTINIQRYVKQCSSSSAFGLIYFSLLTNLFRHKLKQLKKFMQEGGYGTIDKKNCT